MTFRRDFLFLQGKIVRLLTEIALNLRMLQLLLGEFANYHVEMIFHYVVTCISLMANKVD